MSLSFFLQPRFGRAPVESDDDGQVHVRGADRRNASRQAADAIEAIIRRNATAGDPGDPLCSGCTLAVAAGALRILLERNDRSFPRGVSDEPLARALVEAIRL